MSIKQISIAVGLLGLCIFSFFAVRDMTSVDSNTKDTRELYKEMQKEDRGEVPPREGFPDTPPPPPLEAITTTQNASSAPQAENIDSLSTPQ